MPRILIVLLGAIFGRDMKSGGSRLVMLILFGAGWVLGDKFGLPDGLRDFIYSSLDGAWDWIKDMIDQIG